MNEGANVRIMKSKQKLQFTQKNKNLDNQRNVRNIRIVRRTFTTAIANNNLAL